MGKRISHEELTKTIKAAGINEELSESEIEMLWKLYYANRDMAEEYAAKKDELKKLKPNIKRLAERAGIRRAYIHEHEYAKKYVDYLISLAPIDTDLVKTKQDKAKEEKELHKLYKLKDIKIMSLMDENEQLRKENEALREKVISYGNELRKVN